MSHGRQAKAVSGDLSPQVVKNMRVQDNLHTLKRECFPAIYYRQLSVMRSTGKTTGMRLCSSSYTGRSEA